MDNDSDIEFHDDGRTRLEALRHGQLLGRVDYFLLEDAPAARVGVHTEVEPGHQGEGIAGRLATEFYRRAAEAGQAVVPLCPYLKRWSESHPAQAPAASKDQHARAVAWLRRDASAEAE